MQRFEDYNLAGTSRPTPAPTPDTLADRVSRRALDKIRQRSRAASPPVTPRSTKRSAPVVPVTSRGFERRPAGTAALGTRGGESARALRELCNMDRSTLQAIARTDREWPARVVANLDRLIAQLSREPRDERPSC